MESKEQSAVYRFGSYELDLGRHELRRDGRARAVEPQTFDLLTYLVRHRDRLVGKDELNERIWGGRFVTESAQSTYIKLARQAIGDSGRSQTYIRTVRGKGFRFVGEIESQGTQGQPERPSIAVLPFTNLSDDRDQEYFADGMSDDLITHLSKIDGLAVLARNSSFTYKGRNAKVQDIAMDLGVHYVLEGSIRRAGATLRINVQLTDGETGDHIWAEIFDREQQDIFALQDDVIGKIILALRIKLTTEDRRRLAEFPSDKPEAYELYLRARNLHLRNERLYDSDVKGTGLKQALALYEEAINLDPAFAAAYAGIAGVANYIWESTLTWVMNSATAQQLAWQSVTRALKFDPANAEAHDALSFLHFIDMKPDDAVATAEAGVQLNPKSATAHATLAYALALTARWREAEEAADLAIALDSSPNSHVGNQLATAYFLVERHEKAAELFARIVAQAPKSYDGHFGLIVCNGEIGRLKEARQSAEFVSNNLWQAFNRQLIAVKNRHWHPKALSKWLDAMAKAGVPEWPYGFAEDPAKRLGEDEIRRLVVGKRMRGQSIYNMDFDKDVYSDGRIAYVNGWAKTKGNWTLEGDMFWYNSPVIFNNRKFYGHFYRNEFQTEENPHPYIHVNVWDRYYFSVEEIQRDSGK